jgi:acyl-[acyl-carrier-protein]-phospholipid O-acyltransferase/long-chain-fatty-acid--[acyl-carrier-protein] ligase
MTTRRFAPLFWCQFFSAFADNFLKTSLVFLILFHIAGPDSGALIQLAGATLIAPFFFLSGLGGEMADRYDKALVARRLKFVEIGVALVAVAGFAFHSIVLLFIAVGAYGTIASLFGPIKYGILPDHLARTELASGNALVEGGTFLAILLGTIVAGLAAKNGGDPIHFAWLMIVSSVACWIASRYIPPTGEGAPHLKINRNIFASTGTLIKYVRAEPRLWWGAMVASWFWLVGAVVLSLLPTLVTTRIGGTEGVVTIFLTIFSVAVAVGSGLAAWLAHGRIILLPTLVGGVLLGIFALDLGWTSYAIVPGAHALGVGEFFASRYSIHIAIDLAGLAIAGGLFIVPTFTAVQAWAGADHRARVVAAVNVLNAAFMVVGAVVFAVLQKLDLDVPLLFVLIGIANLIVAVIIGRTMPASWMNDFLSIVFRAFFRLEVEGLENVDKAGHNAIIAMNHVSFLDPPIAAIPQIRPHHGPRSAQADGDARRHQCRARRQHAGDISGRPHHRHRQPDENLRRRRDDRRQGRCHGSAGPHRRAGANSLQPFEEHAGTSPVVPANKGNNPGAGQAQCRSGARGAETASRGGGRALRRHV